MKEIIKNWQHYLNEQSTILPYKKIGKVSYDPKGLGSTPIGNNIDYMGFTVWMTSNDFLRLNPKRHSESEYLSQYFQKTEDIIIAPPWISAEYVGNDENPQSGDHWKVVNHEGRGRVIEVEKINPGSLVPVQILPRGGLRARHLTKNMVFSPIESDKRAEFYHIFNPSTVILRGDVLEK